MEIKILEQAINLSRIRIDIYIEVTWSGWESRDRLYVGSQSVSNIR